MTHAAVSRHVLTLLAVHVQLVGPVPDSVTPALKASWSPLGIRLKGAPCSQCTWVSPHRGQASRATGRASLPTPMADADDRDFRLGRRDCLGAQFWEQNLELQARGKGQRGAPWEVATSPLPCPPRGTEGLVRDSICTYLLCSLTPALWEPRAGSCVPNALGSSHPNRAAHTPLLPGDQRPMRGEVSVTQEPEKRGREGWSQGSLHG